MIVEARWSNIFKKFSQMHDIRNLSQVLVEWPEFSAVLLEKAVAKQSHREQRAEEDDSDDDEDDPGTADYAMFRSRMLFR